MSEHQDLPTITLEEIRAWTDEASYGHGTSYFRQSRIRSPRRHDRTLQAECLGSRPEPYLVKITLGEGGIVAGDCSCPVGMGGSCKHAVALLLTWFHMPEAFAEIEPPTAALNNLTREELIASHLSGGRRSRIGAPRLREAAGESSGATRADADAQSVATASSTRTSSRSHCGESSVEGGHPTQSRSRQTDRHAGKGQLRRSSTAPTDRARHLSGPRRPGGVAGSHRRPEKPKPPSPRPARRVGAGRDLTILVLRLSGGLCTEVAHRATVELLSPANIQVTEGAGDNEGSSQAGGTRQIDSEPSTDRHQPADGPAGSAARTEEVPNAGLAVSHGTRRPPHPQNPHLASTVSRRTPAPSLA